jgi:adenosyl cobinamide kinase/adenosyl cobinamide phosphate guanylyltransferase
MAVLLEFLSSVRCAAVLEEIEFPIYPESAINRKFRPHISLIEQAPRDTVPEGQ